jgi:hypothetical protein
MDGSWPETRSPELTVSSLKTAELFALATARLWVARCLNPDRPTPDWDGGFAVAGLEPGCAASFDALFRAIAAGARRDMEFHCPSCPRLAADEAQYLHMLALFQQGRTLEAGTILEDWLTPSALRMALSPAFRFALALTWAGLNLPLRQVEQLPTENGNCAFDTDPGARLIH